MAAPEIREGGDCAISEKEVAVEILFILCRYFLLYSSTSSVRYYECNQLIEETSNISKPFGNDDVGGMCVWRSRFAHRP